MTPLKSVKPPRPASRPTLRLALRVVLGLAVALGIALMVFLRHGIGPAELTAWVRAAGLWGPGVFMVAYILGTLLLLPGSVFTMVGGALFGPVWGAIYGLAAATIGAALAFLIARYLVADWVARRSGARLTRLREGVEAEGWRFVALVRLVPIFPFNLLNYALGLARIPFRDYVLTSFVCMAPATIAYTYLGYAGRQAIAGEKAAIGNGLLALGLLAIVALAPRFVLRLWRPKRK